MIRPSILQRVAPYIFISAFTIPFVIFNLAPIVFSIYLSLTEWNIFGPPRFVGTRHYGRLFQDEFAWIAFTNSVWYALLIVPTIVVIAIGGGAVRQSALAALRIRTQPRSSPHMSFPRR